MSRPAGKSNHLVGREERRGTGFGECVSISISNEDSLYRFFRNRRRIEKKYRNAR